MNIYFTKIVLLCVIIWLSYPLLYSQQGDSIFVYRGESGKIEFAKFNVDENFDRTMQNDTVFLKSILQAKKEDEFRLKSVITDELGITHKRFQQYYKGIKVENAEYLLHGKNDNIEYINKVKGLKG
jgi:Zn-dependent metalloprotease